MSVPSVPRPKVIAGPVLLPHCTVTVNVQVSTKPWSPVAVQVTVVVPTGNMVPEAGLQVTFAFGLQTVGWKDTTVPLEEVQLVTMLAGH